MDRERSIDREHSTRVDARELLDFEPSRPTSSSISDARKVKLVVVEGRPLGAEVPIDGPRFLIGRDQTCRLRPKNPLVSGRQCAIVRKGPHVVVRDLGSANGTLVNEHCLHAGEEHRVSDGDRLQVGRLIFSIRIEDDPAEAEVERWLLGAPEPSGAFHAVADAASGFRADLKAATSEPRRASAQGSIASKASESGPASAVPFVYRRFDPEREVVRVGLGSLQLIDEEQIRAARSTLFGMVAQPRFRRLVLDLSEIDTLPSMAIALILALARRCRSAGGELRLCSLSLEVDRVVSRLGIDRIVACFADPIEARDSPWTDSADGVRS